MSASFWVNKNEHTERKENNAEDDVQILQATRVPVDERRGFCGECAHKKERYAKAKRIRE